MRRLLPAVALLALAVPALAQPEAYTWTRRNQGTAFATAYRSLAAATSACVIAPTGTTCTNGVNFTKGTLRSLIVENIGGGDAYCDETADAVAAQGFLLTANGGAITLDHSLGAITLYCISTPGTVIAVVTER